MSGWFLLASAIAQCMLTLSTNLENSICAQFKEDGTVCRGSLCFNIFSIFAVDNIDHKPSSGAATNSWHGTGDTPCQIL